MRWPPAVRARGREFYLRLVAASKVEAILDLFNVLGLGYQIVFAAYSVKVRLQNQEFPLWSAILFALAMGYTTVHRLFLRGRFQAKKWFAASLNRAETLHVAISRLARGLRMKALDAMTVDQVENSLLIAMKSEIEAEVVDAQGIYLNVTLLIDDPKAKDRLYCLNRANRNRELYVSYKKDGMVAATAMQTQKYAHEANKAYEGKPYRSILAFPIILRGESEESVGAVSIDSSQPYHFEGRETKIEMRILPYLGLIKLALVLREKYKLTEGRVS